MIDAQASLAAKVAFLRGMCGPDDAVVETHFAWVFLVGDRAWKLRKPVRRDRMDYGSVEARRIDSLAEVRLNRRLAPDVYLNAAPLTLDADGHLGIDGKGATVDWLVSMRRLDRSQQLDARLATGGITDLESSELARRLADFYRHAELACAAGQEFADRLRRQVAANHDVLAKAGLPGAEDLHAMQESFIAGQRAMLASRAASGCVVEAHGDLRPEHIFLTRPPVVIDCLEFDRDLRLMDRAEELSFLELECARIGHATVGRQLRTGCLAVLGDDAPPGLLAFYRGHRAATRAKLYVWRAGEADGGTPGQWLARAGSYVRGALAEHAGVAS